MKASRMSRMCTGIAAAVIALGGVVGGVAVAQSDASISGAWAESATAAPLSGDVEVAHGHSQQFSAHIFTGENDLVMHPGETSGVKFAAMVLDAAKSEAVPGVHADFQVWAHQSPLELSVAADEHDDDHDHGDGEDSENMVQPLHGDDHDHDHRDGYEFGVATVTVPEWLESGTYQFTLGARLTPAEDPGGDDDHDDEPPSVTEYGGSELITYRSFSVRVTDEAEADEPHGSLYVSRAGVSLTGGQQTGFGYVTGYGDLATGGSVDEVKAEVTATAHGPLSVELTDVSHGEDGFAPRHGYVVATANEDATPGKYRVDVTSKLTVPGQDEPVTVRRSVMVQVDEHHGRHR